MTELAPVIPSVLGGGALAAVVFYLLRHITGLYRQLGTAQAASSASATERAIRAEADIARLTLRVVELEQAQREVAADWAKRSSALSVIRRTHPIEAAAHRLVESLVDEILSGADPDVT